MKEKSAQTSIKPPCRTSQHRHQANRTQHATQPMHNSRSMTTTCSSTHHACDACDCDVPACDEMRCAAIMAAAHIHHHGTYVHMLRACAWPKKAVGASKQQQDTLPDISNLCLYAPCWLYANACSRLPATKASVQATNQFPPPRSQLWPGSRR